MHFMQPTHFYHLLSSISGLISFLTFYLFFFPLCPSLLLRPVILNSRCPSEPRVDIFKIKDLGSTMWSMHLYVSETPHTRLMRSAPQGCWLRVCIGKQGWTSSTVPCFRCWHLLCRNYISAVSITSICLQFLYVNTNLA